MFSFAWVFSQSVRPCLRPWTRTPFLPSHVSFSSTRPIAITRVQREQESEQARAARLARKRQYEKTRLANENDQEREARLFRQRQYNKLRRANETAEARAARLARMHEYRTACRECETDKQRQERLARERQARADSPQKFLAYQRKFGRKPENREKTKQKNREYRKKHPGVEHLQHEQLSIRRATRLVEQVFSGRSKTIANTYTWKTHTPVSFDDKVEHHCTACHRFRFLKHWWKEKSRPETTETSSNHDRYMCSRCFANDWNLVVPETFSGRLPRLFTSPDYPPPFRKERLKANKSAHDIKKQHEEDEKENERS